MGRGEGGGLTGRSSSGQTNSLACYYPRLKTVQLLTVKVDNLSYRLDDNIGCGALSMSSDV